MAVKEGMYSWEAEDELLRSLSRVERVVVTLGRDQRVWHLNLLKGTKETLKAIGYGEVFPEKRPAASRPPSAPV